MATAKIKSKPQKKAVILFQPLRSNIKSPINGERLDEARHNLLEFWKREVVSREGHVVAVEEIPVRAKHTHESSEIVEGCLACKLHAKAATGRPVLRYEVTIERSRIKKTKALHERQVVLNYRLNKRWGRKQRIVISLAAWEAKALDIVTGT